MEDGRLDRGLLCPNGQPFCLYLLPFPCRLPRRGMMEASRITLSRKRLPPMAVEAFTDLDRRCANTIRVLTIDAVQAAKSGHPGLPMGTADLAHVLWTRFLRHNPANPHWFNRDRFVLSGGHGSMLLYSLLHLTGYAVSL